MQRCTCTVRLGGNLGSTSELTDVSPAEVLILRHIHGDDAVIGFRPGGNDRGRAIDERGRLFEKYRGAFAEVFPGAAPSMPETFKAIGVNLWAETEENQAPDDDKPKGRKGGRKGKKDKADNPDSGEQLESATQDVDPSELTGADNDEPGDGDHDDNAE